MTIEEAAKILGLFPSTVGGYCRRGRIICRKVPGKRGLEWDIPRRVVLAYANGQAAIRTAIYCPRCGEFYPAREEGAVCPRCGRYDPAFSVVRYDWRLYPYDWDSVKGDDECAQVAKRI